VPLPTDPPGDITTEVCCDGFYEVAKALVDEAYAALADCLGAQCKDVAHFVSVNEPTYTNDGNYIAVWLAAMQPAAGGPGGISLMPRPRATFGFKLIETGYPTLESTAASIMPPDGDHIDIISKHSYSHIERIIRQVYMSFRSRTLPSGCECGRPQMGRQRPAARSGGLAGWLWELSLDICW
jgi:phage tail protein X